MIRFLLFLQQLLGVQLAVACAQIPAQLVLNRYSSSLLKDNPISPATVNSIVSQLKNQQWCDLDYVSSALKDDWMPRKH